MYLMPEYDVVIVGSGAGGGAVAYGLAVKGIKALVLEAGRRYNPYKDYPLERYDFESKGFPWDTSLSKFTFGRRQKLKEEFSHLFSWNKAYGRLNTTNYRQYLAYQHIKGVGGTTLQFSGEAHRLHPNAFKMHTLFGVGHDWPISYEDLAPYYDMAEEIIGVAGPESNPFKPGKYPYPLPPHPLSWATKSVKKGFTGLGLSLIEDSVAILSRPYKGRVPCNYCNGCHYGCPRKDKGSVDVTFLAEAESTGNCRIFENAFVYKVVMDKQNKVKGVLYYDASGKEHFAPLKILVLACGAVETPRLILNSNIANSNGQVGKNLMETLFWFSTSLHTEYIQSYRGIPRDSICWDFNDPLKNKDFIGGFKLNPSALDLIGPISYAHRLVEGCGDEHLENMQKVYWRAIGIKAVGEFFPNKDTFIDIDNNEKDRFGIPVARISAFLGENEIKLLGFMAKITREILKSAGINNLVEERSSFDYFYATHVFGTCKMGSNAEYSVVNKNCQSHEIGNLFIVDNSVFPSTGGGDGPSLTIEALGLRAADFIAEMMR